MSVFTSGRKMTEKERVAYELGKLDAIKHGRWERSEWGYPDRTVTCSCCGFTFDSTDYTTPKFQQKVISYCPNCGAKMDLED